MLSFFHPPKQRFLRPLLDPLQLDQQINQLVGGHILQISVSNETGPVVVRGDMIEQLVTADYRTEPRRDVGNLPGGW